MRIVALPYEIAPDHGKDLRDWLNDGHTMDELVAMAEAAPAFTAEQAQAATEPKKPDPPPYVPFPTDALPQVGGGLHQPGCSGPWLR